MPKHKIAIKCWCYSPQKTKQVTHIVTNRRIKQTTCFINFSIAKL